MNFPSKIDSRNKMFLTDMDSPSGQHFNGMISALRLIGLTGVATVDQIAEILRDDFDHSETERLITHIIQEKYVSEKETAPPVENYFSKVIFSLTVTGYRKIRKANPELAENLIVGDSDGENLLTSEKALLVTESLVEWNREHQIIMFLDAHRLPKRNIVKQIKTFVDENTYADEVKLTSFLDVINDENEFKEDYLVVLKHRKSNVVDIKRCRIAVKQNFETMDISTAARFVWFAASNRQAEKIVELSDDSIKLQGILKPLSVNLWHMKNVKARQILDSKKNRPVSVALNNTDADVLKLLRQTNLTLSANEITAVLYKNGEDLEASYRKVYCARAKLLKMGLVKKRDGKIRPGYNFGRPLQFLFLPENERFFKQKTFQRQVILGYLFSKRIKEGWRIVKFDPAAPSLTMELNGQRMTFVSDYTDGEHNYSVEKTVEAFIKFDAGKSPRALVMVDYSRYRMVTKRIKKEYIINLCDDFNQYDTAPARRPAR